MKVAITAKDKTLGCQMDPRFGRAAYFLIVDTDSGECEAHDNRACAQSVSGAGVQAGKNVVDLGASVLITGNMGPKALGVLQAGGVEVFAGLSGTAQNALRRFQAGQLKPILQPNAQGHWATASS